MAIFKCKMCGATLKVPKDTYVLECEYCGTEQTIPKIDSKEIEKLYERASDYFQENDYDNASKIYNEILNENPIDPEAYWSLVLCKYGIQYVDDPKTKNKVATINRAQYKSILDDNNYKKSIKCATEEQKVIYENEAKYIEKVQKKILDISKKEKPYDVFICYKETDGKGRRTEDSVIAMDIYNALTKEGLRVFFAKVSLEDKLGTEYEPYIFAAINSAKVMVVVGTNPEYFNAPWVKNEWTRYLNRFSNKNENCNLIPVYKNISAYSLPAEFNKYQAQDISSVGSLQDLVYGIKKISRLKIKQNYNGNKNHYFFFGLIICFFIMSIFFFQYFGKIKHIVPLNISIAGVNYNENLTFLSISDIRLTEDDLINISKLTNLEKITFSGCTIPNLLFLEKLDKLDSIYIKDRTEIINKDMTTVCDSIQTLSIANTDIGSIEFINNMPNLKSLSLTRRYYVDLSPIKNHSKLNNIGWTGDGTVPVIRNLDWCEGLTSLTTISIYNSSMVSKELRSIEGLRKLVNLRNFRFCFPDGIYNWDLSAFENMPNLESLDIAFYNDSTNYDNYHVKDLNFVSKLSKLKYFKLWAGADYIKLDGVNNLISLEDLDIHGYIIDTDCANINNLKKLKTLRLDNVAAGKNYNDINFFDVAGINSLKNIKSVEIIPWFNSKLINIEQVNKIQDCIYIFNN